MRTYKIIAAVTIDGDPEREADIQAEADELATSQIVALRRFLATWEPNPPLNEGAYMVIYCGLAEETPGQEAELKPWHGNLWMMKYSSEILAAMGGDWEARWRAHVEAHHLQLAGQDVPDPLTEAELLQVLNFADDWWQSHKKKGSHEKRP